MRNFDKKIVFVLFIMIITLFVQYKFFPITNIFNIIFLSLSYLLLIAFIGIRKDKSLNKIDISQIVFIYTVIYLILIYLSGLFLGFVRTPYNNEILKITINVLPLIVIIIIKELFRFAVVSKTNNKITLSFLIVLLSLFDIFLGLGSYDLTNSLGIFEVCSCLIVPAMVNNILLTYISQKSGYIPCIIYSILINTYVFIIPIVPDLGIYLDSILKIVFPAILFLRINTIFGKNNFSTNRNEKFVKALITIPIICLFVTLIILVSGIFKYNIMSVGSNSMYKVIKKGDAVIVLKYKQKEIKNIKKGDILVYYHDSKVILHRVTNIVKENDKLLFKTKGDNNETEDKWITKQEDVVGIITFKIPFLGYPSVILEEYLNK